MKYQLDNFVFYEMNGLARLLFESTGYYIYIWLDEKLCIKAIQICDSNRNNNVDERLDSSGLVFAYLKDSTKMKAYVTEQAISLFSEVENEKFSHMFHYLKSLKPEDDVVYQLDKNKRGLAERWLLGEDLESEELETLGINSVVEEDDVCLAMIKIITENLDRVLILYFDELESPFRMHGEAAERKLLEIIKRLYNEVKGLVVVAAVLKEIWPRVLEIAANVLEINIMEEIALNSRDDFMAR